LGKKTTKKKATRGDGVGKDAGGGKKGGGGGLAATEKSGDKRATNGRRVSHREKKTWRRKEKTY